MPPHDSERRHDEHGEDARAIHGLTHILADWLAESKMQFQWMATHHHFATQHDLENLNQDLTMKLSEIKTAISTASRQQKEALTEIGTKIADLNNQIADLIAGASDPDVTDEAFLADLTSLQSDSQALADLVPGSVTSGSGQV
jgi:hypothetical protein